MAIVKLVQMHTLPNVNKVDFELTIVPGETSYVGVEGSGECRWI